MKTILAWHWSDGLKCQYDGRPIVPGQTLVYEGVEPIKLCKRGLHASTRILDALKFAPGTTVSRVRLSGEIIRGDDKLVATKRTCLWSFDAKYILISWAADCVERALLRERKDRIEPGFLRRFAAIKAARRFVKDPSEENRRAAGYFSDEVSTDETYVYIHATRAAGVVAETTSALLFPTDHRAGAAYFTARAVTAQLEAYRKERMWQSARLRNLIARGRQEKAHEPKTD